MSPDIYHGIFLDHSFNDLGFVYKFDVINKKEVGSWIIVMVTIGKEDVKDIIKMVQNEMVSNGKYYNHLYNDHELIVIFKEKVFYVTSDPSSWGKVMAYGKSLGIPEEQLDFCPCKAEEERNYFNVTNKLR